MTNSGKLGGQVGQRPLIIVGGLLFAASGLYLAVVTSGDVAYLSEVAIPLALMAVAIPLVFPQTTSVAAQALPANRVGVGGATTQAIRQFGGSLGVAITIALLGAPTDPGEIPGRFDRIWWFLVLGGLLTSAAALPLRTRRVG